jgi:hypothetical protein
LKKSGLRFLYYRCTHKSKQTVCQSRKFVRDHIFEAEVKRNVALVSLPEEWKERFLAKVETWESEAIAATELQRARLQAERQQLGEKIDRLNTAFADGALDIAQFREMKNPLISRKVELDEKITHLSTGKAIWLEPIRNWICEANTVEELVSGSNWPEMKSLLAAAFATKRDVAKAARISVRTVDNLMRSRKIPFLRLSARCVRFHLPSVLAALRQYEIIAVSAVPTRRRRATSTPIKP